MNFKHFTYLILSFFIFSCSNGQEQINNQGTGFSEDKAKELADLLNSSDSINISILEEVNLQDSIWKLATRDVENCTNPIIKNFDNKTWSYCEEGNEIELYQVEYTDNNIYFTEKFLLKDKQLVYAVEWEKRTVDLNDNEATWWNCEYVIQDNNVVSHSSLGMGKTEDKSFNTQDIIALWNSRKGEFSKLKK